MFHVRRLRGEGAYAKVYQASTLDPMNVTILPSLDDSDDEDEEEDDEKQVRENRIQRDGQDLQSVWMLMEHAGIAGMYMYDYFFFFRIFQ